MSTEAAVAKHCEVNAEPPHDVTDRADARARVSGTQRLRHTSVSIRIHGQDLRFPVGKRFSHAIALIVCASDTTDRTSRFFSISLPLY
jgi:hypothetical protein